MNRAGPHVTVFLRLVVGVDQGADELSFRTFHPPKHELVETREANLSQTIGSGCLSSSPWVSPSLTPQTGFPFIPSSLQLAFALGL